jgi:dTDP-4-amino-4,6-dideoxygalactose transaminase
VLVDPDTFGSEAAWLDLALAAEGIETRRYYSPPVHEMRAYRRPAGTNGNLGVTEAAASRVLTLPMWSEMTDEHVSRMTDALWRLYRSLGDRTAVG